MVVHQRTNDKMRIYKTIYLLFGLCERAIIYIVRTLGVSENERFEPKTAVANIGAGRQ